MSKKKVNFEESLKKLEEVVSGLESGELTLEDSLKAFEEGVELYKNCKEKLDTAQKKLSKLSDDLKEESFE